MEINRRNLYKTWLFIKHKVEDGKAIMQESWYIFDNFMDWYYNQVKELSDTCQYTIDTNIGDWYSLEDVSIYNENIANVIPTHIYDSLKTIVPRKQIGNKYGPGVSCSAGQYKVNFKSIDGKRKSIGIYSSPEEAFYVYKFNKEAEIKEVATLFYNNHCITDKAYNLLMNLEIIAINIEANNYIQNDIAAMMDYRNSLPRKVVHFDSPEQEHVGTYHWINNFSDQLIILEYIDKFHVKVKFLDWYGYETYANIDNIRAGHVKNPYHILSNGGYYVEGPYSSVKHSKIYKTWDSMLRRAYFKNVKGEKIILIAH